MKFQSRDADQTLAMTANNTDAYLRTKVMTASPAELRLLLIEGAIRFAQQGREGLITKDHERSYDGLTQCKSILLELVNCLKPEADPDLCDKLSSLYTFMYRRLLDVTIEKDVEILDEVLSLLQYERETWIMLMEKLSEESRDALSPTPTATNEQPARKPLSIEG